MSCDNGDGSYKIEWQSEKAGIYLVNVTIANVNLVGSPMELRLHAGQPDINKFVVSGEGVVPGWRTFGGRLMVFVCVEGGGAAPP